MVSSDLWDEETAASYDRDAAEMFSAEVVDPTVEFLARLAGSGRVLEFAIGTGRIGIPLMQRGIAVTGVELSAPMASQLRAKVSHAELPVLIGDMVTTPLGDKIPSLTGVRLKNVKTGETRTIEAAGMFVAIGHTPNTKFLNGQLETDDKGFVKLIEPHRTLTSVEGVFAAGDVADPIYKQAITAAGMGCKAALDAERWLAAKGTH